MKRIFVFLIVLMFMGGLFLVPQNVDLNEYDGVDALGNSILASDWSEGDSVSVDLNFMPVIPTSFETYIGYDEYVDYDVYQNGDSGPLSYLFVNDGNYHWLEIHNKSYTDDVNMTFFLTTEYTFDLQYTDVDDLFYDWAINTNDALSRSDTSLSQIMYAVDFESGGLDTVVDWGTTWNSVGLGSSGTYGSLTDDNFMNGQMVIRVESSSQQNSSQTTDLGFYMRGDQLKLNFNNISGSLYPSEYRIKDDNSYEHRMFIECPEYRTQIAITIPALWTFDRTIPEVDTRESGGVLYLEDNTLPITYTVFFTGDADGTISDESITSFSETLTDDVMFYPDTDDYWNDSVDGVADATSYDEGVGIPVHTGDITDTYVNDTDNEYLLSVGSLSSWINIRYNLSVPQHMPYETYKVHIHALISATAGGTQTSYGRYRIYNFTSSAWNSWWSFASEAGAGMSENIYRSDTISYTHNVGDSSGSNSTIWISFESMLNDEGEATFLNIYFVSNTFEDITIEGYAESFADISDWTLGTGIAPTTDGDVMSWDVPADASYDNIHVDIPDLDYDGYYLEFRYQVNETGMAYGRWHLRSDDAGGGDDRFNSILYYNTEGWSTVKIFIVSSGVAGSLLWSVIDYGANPVRLQLDYLRIGPADEMGWQHDGSTTEGVTAKESGVTFTATSDGDILTSTSTYIDASKWAGFKISYDTTTTSSYLERDYYPFIEIRYRYNYSAGTSGLGIWAQYDHYGYAITGGAQNTWITTRVNIKASTSVRNYNYIWFYGQVDSAGETFTYDVDYVQIYSIANFTVQPEGCGTDDYLYADSGVLYAVGASFSNQYLLHDPAMSADTSVYNVGNLTTDGSDIRINLEVSGSWMGWQTETRFALDSGTLEDFAFRMYEAGSISAIKFWSDHTAPVFEDLSVSPLDAYNDEEVTITAIIDDVGTIYEVTMNADVYPAGFNDIDYDLEEETTGMWDYTFATMTEGEYIFTLTATDGVNTATDTIAFTIRERIFEVTDYTYDYNDNTIVVKGTPNMDGSYTLYHNDNNVDTGSFEEHTIFLVEWTRSTTAGLHKMGLYCYNGSDYQWVNGSYYIASEEGLSLSVVTSSIGYQVTAYIETNWGNTTITVYENDAQKDTDDEGNTLSYDKSQIEGNYSVGVKVDGTADLIWYNFTYEVLQDDLSITALNYDTAGDDVSVFINTNWGNTTITIYEDDVQKATDSEGTLSYVKTTTAGDYEVGVKIDGTADLLWANFTYSIGAEDVLSITSLSFGSDGADITAFATTNWMNTTLTLYEDDIQQDTDSEGNTLSYTKSTTAGDYNVGLKIDGTADSIWANYTYTISAEDELSITALSFDSSGINVMAFVNTNWGNCTLTIYEDDVQKDTGNEGTLEYVKATTAGDYAVGIKIDGTADLIWANYTYTIAPDEELIVSAITFFGASADFDYMQFSGFINYDCDYNISEWSDSWAKNETHTGSVTAGLFNIAWDKIGVNDIDANFTIVFVNGSLSYTIEGSYQTAYKILRITEIVVDNLEESNPTPTNLTINFYTNKDIDWYVYDVDNSDAVLANGTSTEGSDSLTWVKNKELFTHNYAVKWTDGVSNIWFNSSYWTYKQNIDDIKPAGVDWGAEDQRRTIEFWSTVGAIAAVIGVLVIAYSHFGRKDDLKELQLPHYSTREDRRQGRG